VHLGEAEPGRDRGLAEPVAEAERDDPALPRREPAERALDGDPVLRRAQRVGLVREPVLVERHDERRGCSRDLLSPRPGCAGAFLVGGRAAETGHELPVERGEGATELVDAPRRAHGLDAVAEVPAQLAVDRGDGERDEVVAPSGVEPVDRREERHDTDLLEILERLAAAAVATREGRDQREMQLDEPSPGIRVAVTVGAQVAATLPLDLRNDGCHS
jgi:hypothetical protein